MGGFKHKQWKNSKEECNVTSTTMEVFLEAPGEEFFSVAKQTRNTKKSIEELSSYAKELFWVFFKPKKTFVNLVDMAFFRPLSSLSNRLEPWPKSSWELVYQNLKLEIIGFKLVSN
jgi:hypothetical protein